MSKSVKRTVTITSTGWRSLKIRFVSNFRDEIKSSRRFWSAKDKCYKRTFTGEVAEKDARELYIILRHLEYDCDESTCKYCKLSRKYD